MEALRGLVFSNMKGQIIVIDNIPLTFRDVEHMNIYIYGRKQYFETLFSTKLTESPDSYETMKRSQIERVFRLTAKQFEFHPSLMFSSSRRGEIMEAKKFAVKMCMMGGMTEPIISDEIQKHYPGVKGYERSNIIHHHQEINNLIETETKTKVKYALIKNKVLIELNGEFDEVGSGTKLK